MPHRGPLSGVRVVEIANYLSVPLATMMLADLGAEVVKVEPPRGDPFRKFGRPAKPMSAVFANSNRGKQSVLLDLKEPDAREQLLQLTDAADVVMSNWRPGVAERLELPDSLLAARNPRLVRVYVSGFGLSGPHAQRPTFDSIVQALTGTMWAQGTDERPQFAVGYLIDKVTASMAAQAVLAALVERSRTGEGQAVELSMLDTAAYFNFPELGTNRTFLDDAPAEPRFQQVAALRPVRAADGWFVISAVSGDQIRAAMAAVGTPERADELLAIRDGDELVRRIFDAVEEVTEKQSLADCIDAMNRHDVPVAPVLDLDGHLADEQVVYNEIYDTVDDPVLGPMRRVRYPARFARWGHLRGGPPPSVPR